MIIQAPIFFIKPESEILSELMYWQPNVVVLEEEGGLNIIQKLKGILNEMVTRQGKSLIFKSDFIIISVLPKVLPKLYY